MIPGSLPRKRLLRWKRLSKSAKRQNIKTPFFRLSWRRNVLKRKSSIGQSRNKLTRLLTVPFTAMTALMLTGCGQSIPLLLERPKPPANLMQPCPPLTPLSGVDGSAVLRKMTGIGEEYNDCADRHNKLIEAVK